MNKDQLARNLRIRAMWCYSQHKDPKRDKPCAELYGKYQELTTKAEADDVLTKAEATVNARQRPRH